MDYALEQLGTDYIDIIVLCRVPSDIPIEEVVQNMQTVVQSGTTTTSHSISLLSLTSMRQFLSICAGKARHIGLSEASASTIRRAHAVVPIYCIEQEWSLWSRDIEKEIVPACRELGTLSTQFINHPFNFCLHVVMDRKYNKLQVTHPICLCCSSHRHQDCCVFSSGPWLPHRHHQESRLSCT